MRKLLNEIRVMMTPRDKMLMLVLTGLMVAGALLEIVGITILMPVIAVLSKPELLEQNKYLHFLYRLLDPPDLGTFTLYLCCGISVFYLLKNSFLMVMTYWQSAFIYGKASSWGARLYVNYLETDYAFHLKHNSSELLNNINQLQIVSTGVLLPLMMLISEGIVIVAILLLLLCFAPGTTLTAFATVLLATLLLYYPFRKLYARLGVRLYQASHKKFQLLMQGVGGIKEVKVRNLEKRFSQLLQQAQSEACRAESLIYFTGQFPRLALEAVIVILAMGILAAFILANMASGTIVLTLALMAMAMFRLLPAVSRIQYNFVRIRQSLCSFDAIYHDLTQLVREDKKGNGPPIEFGGMLRLNNITFAYSPETPPIFRNFSAEIPVRSSTALTGTTGCGKTTLADLILGLLKPDAGSITVDGRDIRENLGSWQKLIGYVPQHIYLLDASIRENVALGVPPEEIDDDKVKRCLEMAQLADFAEGAGTLIGERGARLSGGQRQRLGVARALYHDPEVLVLDEATSALDTETEQALIDALNLLHGRLTIIMIAHRLSTIEQCDVRINLSPNTEK